MESDWEPEVRVQLREQTSTLQLSDDDFATKAAAAAARIKAFQSAQSNAANTAGTLALAAVKLSTIAEDDSFKCTQTGDNDPVLDEQERTRGTLPSPDKDKRLFPHPGKLVLSPSNAPVYNSDDASLSDRASDVTARPSYETGSTAAESVSAYPTQLYTRERDGSYKEIDMREVAPWLYQEDGYAHSPRPRDQTPPSSLGRASKYGGLVHSKTAYKLGTIEDDEFAFNSPNSSTTITPKTVTPGDRKSSFKDVFSPSPTSTIRRISSKLSFATLRKPALKPDGLSQSESYSPLGRSFHSPAAEHDSDSSNSTIGCAPYEDHTYGPAPRTHRTEDIDGVRSRRGFRPLSVITSAVNYSINPFPPMDTVLSPHNPAEDNHVGAIYHRAPCNISTETVLLVPKLRRLNTEDPPSNDDYAVTSSSSEDTPEIVHGDASTLFNTPPPLLSDHPLNREGENAFKVKTEYPLMTTSTPASVIRALAQDMNQVSSRSASFFDDLRKKKSYHNLGDFLPRSAPPNRLEYGFEIQSMATARSSGKSRGSTDSIPTPPSLTRAPTFESDGSRGKSMRKISTFFTRSSKDADSPTELPSADQTLGFSKKSRRNDKLRSIEGTGPASSKNSKRKMKQLFSDIPDVTDKKQHEYMERLIRNRLAWHRHDYKAGKWPNYPPQPNNPNKGWEHANLKCNECSENPCGCCGKACCAYRALDTRIKLFPGGSDTQKGSPLANSIEYKEAIEALRFAKGETPTFLQCTECKRMICPSCCGICPVDGCADTLCRKCKAGDPWSPCNWHDQSRQTATSSESQKNTEGNSSTTSMSPLAKALRKEWLESLEEKYIVEETRGGPRAFWHRKAGI